MIRILIRSIRRFGLWCPGLALLLLASAARANGLALSAEERAWIAEHPVLRVASSRSYGPFTFVDAGGAVRGLSIDYATRLQQLTGLQLQLMPPAPFADSMQALRGGRLDMMMSLRDAPERREFLAFTRPYISVPAVLLRRRVAGAAGAEAGELAPGEPVSVSRGYAVGGFLAERFPGNPLQIESDDRNLLRRLAGGEIGAGVADLASATFLMRSDGIGNVRVVADIGFAYDLGIGYRRDWPMLGRILQKGLDQIGADERQKIADRWIPLDRDSAGLRREVVIAATGVLALGLAAVGLLYAWNRALRRQVVARTEQLRQELAERRRLQDADHARAVAELANRAKTEFMSQASHELRTPLNAVLGFAQLLENDAARPLDATQRQRIAHIESAARHLLVLIEDMMSFSRLESGSLAVEPRPLDAGPVVQRCVELAMPAAQAAGIALRYAPDTQQRMALADPVRLEQVLHNLLSNAIKYNRRGSWVSVSAGPREPALFCIEVADGGLGLSAEQQSQLFQPFNRLGRGATTEGTGIGLVICKQLTERMGGRIRVHSEAGEGSRFTLELQAAAAV
ncbi:ATP-binding protein [Roseateles violae]|uniref:histidine kinase n=1 Tax=Roseateles violae TaxID=3058042 RepID=A0ABT8DZ74_9BURK|nr:transporter substrate-binding domain-containing protein [Pelomonas sp. PFR6]MDN3922893.1 transporter substrate-binding domain-containing protein [Pelomonas sp. PFR6]